MFYMWGSFVGLIRVIKWNKNSFIVELRENPLSRTIPFDLVEPSRSNLIVTQHKITQLKKKDIIPVMWNCEVCECAVQHYWVKSWMEDCYLFDSLGMKTCIHTLWRVDSDVMQLLSHLGSDLLSLLAVFLQVSDLHGQRAVPHHQHRLLVWDHRQSCSWDQRGQTNRARCGTNNKPAELTKLVLVLWESSAQNQHHVLPV